MVIIGGGGVAYQSISNNENIENRNRKHGEKRRKISNQYVKSAAGRMA